MSGTPPLAVLASSLDQLGDLLVHVNGETLDGPTPCSEWTLGDLVDHVLAAPGKFVDFHDSLFGKQPEENGPGWTQAQLSNLAARLGVSGQAFDGAGFSPASETPSGSSSEHAPVTPTSAANKQARVTHSFIPTPD